MQKMIRLDKEEHDEELIHDEDDPFKVS